MRKIVSILTFVGVSVFSVACTQAERNRTEAAAERAGDRAEGAAARTGDAMDNAGLTTKVKAKLAADVRLSTLTSINVDSRDGVVTLTGTVPTADDVRQAEAVAKAAEGVVRVMNNLTVAP